ANSATDYAETDSIVSVTASGDVDLSSVGITSAATALYNSYATSALTGSAGGNFAVTGDVVLSANSDSETESAYVRSVANINAASVNLVNVDVSSNVNGYNYAGG